MTELHRLIDGNADGFLTHAEVDAYAGSSGYAEAQHAKDLINHADADKDEQVSVQELAAAGPSLNETSVSLLFAHVAHINKMEGYNMGEDEEGEEIDDS